MSSVKKGIAGVYGDYYIQARLYTDDKPVPTAPNTILVAPYLPDGNLFTISATYTDRSGAATFIKGTYSTKDVHRIRFRYSTDESSGLARITVIDRSGTEPAPKSLKGDYLSINYNDCPACLCRDKTKTTYGEFPETVDLSYENVATYANAPIESLRECFNGCTNLENAPEIPQYITGAMDYCFCDCTALHGNIVVNNNPSTYYEIFKNTENDIFIVDGGTANEDKWRTIASNYFNVHYEAEDNPIPTISDFKVTRVSNNGSIEFDPTGLYAYVQAKLMVYDNLIPVGWTNELKGITLKDDGKVRSVVWQPKIADYPADVYCWVYLGDTSTHNLSLQIADSIKDDDGIERNSRSSDILTQTLPKSYVLIDYYHDETTNTEGMAIGKYAEVADLLDVDMPALFRQNLSAENILLELDTTEPPDTSTTDGQIYQALINLNWTDVIV